jgi:FkbM family methyltransferase
MKTVNYNGKNLMLGTIAESSEVIMDHMIYSFKKETDKDEWYYQFNCQVKEMENFIELTKDKKCFLDVGSQFGNFSFSFIGNDDTKKAYAFDGGINPYLVTSQIKLINELHNFHTFNFLIGNRNEQVKCFSESLQSLAIPGDDTRLMFSIDTLCAIYDITPDVIKIDIEGAEGDALDGAINAISNYQPMIFIEIHPKFLQMYNNSVEKIVNFVENINYDVFDMNGNKVDNYLEILKQEKSDSNRTVWKSKI